MSEQSPSASDRSAVVIGASGGIGSALVAALASDPSIGHVFAASRSQPGTLPAGAEPVAIDITDEASIEKAAVRCRLDAGLDLIIVASGVLHEGERFLPEKSWSEIEADNLRHAFAVNCTGPALVAKHFLPLLARDRRAVFAALSARVGSIGDNRLGGWYAYRASKAALNMLIRTLALELRRKNPHALCIGLHPGTVDTALSAPYQSRVPESRLFTPERAARQLLDVIAEAQPGNSGRVLAWDGQPVPP